ncbi:sterol-sensing domain of SREBP cleavage-activation-domain-containing protein [Jimgerdemannia flammicorona]|uniref:Sterol-sensing domain of SREBP cleavage-activation-domain-containing protein n=1 Tax=Jimgerdemannia flammicorona TaxID=994334 RepID=A0A433QTX5_9FUNG|nr:sterol-sensing domain of SREBP cleavage-activation-domain-containing protein [Jimgerdemannia flammicorona]
MLILQLAEKCVRRTSPLTTRDAPSYRATGSRHSPSAIFAQQREAAPHTLLLPHTAFSTPFDYNLKSPLPQSISSSPPPPAPRQNGTNVMFRWVEPLRREVSELFYLYGRHCTSHTTRTILLATLVVFVLTYPATNYLRQANLQPESTRFWESSMSISPLAPELSNSEYLRDKPLLRIEQVIITATNSMLQHARDRDRDAGALTKDVLLYTHRLQGRLATTSVSLTASNSQSLPHLRHYTLSDICFKPFNDTRCLVHSALDYWHNSTRLHDDPHILRTLNDQRLHVSPLGLRLHPATLYGHPRYDDTSRAIYGADSVILTYFLQDHGTVDRDTVMRIWNAVWEKIVDGGEIMGGFKGVNVQISRAEEASVKPRAIFRKGKGESKFAIFQHNYLPSPFPHSFLLFTFYISIFFFVSHYFGRVQLVKSKYGLGLTAVCLIFASVSCAIGVSALLDLRMRLVPWWVYPVVAAVAGLENMFILTNAVVCAGVDGEVKEKVARGLRVVGAYITAVLLAEIAILVIGASASIPAVREFCLFTIIALCVDYGLQMTFFVTVLSVDVRRLELADLDNRRVATHLRRKHEDSDNEMEPDKSSHPVPVLEDEEEVDEDAVCVIYKDRDAVVETRSNW